jgi:hypothetical protein
MLDTDTIEGEETATALAPLHHESQDSVQSIIASVMGSVIVAIVMIVAVLQPDLSFAFDLIGSAFAPIIFFIVPAIFYLRVHGNIHKYINYYRYTDDRYPQLKQENEKRLVELLRDSSPAEDDSDVVASDSSDGTKSHPDQPVPAANEGRFQTFLWWWDTSFEKMLRLQCGPSSSCGCIASIVILVVGVFLSIVSLVMTIILDTSVGDYL